MATSSNPNSPTPPNAAKSPTDEFMPPSSTAPKSGGGMSPMIGAIILVIVMVIAGAGTYFAFSGLSGQSSTKTVGGVPSTSTTCVPPINLPQCAKVNKTAIPGATIFAPVTSSSAGNPLTFSISTKAGAPTQVVFYPGDGSKVTSTSATITYTYTTPGLFYPSVLATAPNGNIYENYQSLVSISVTQSTLLTQESQPTLLGNVVGSNTATIPSGGSLTLQGVIASPPASSAWTVVSTSWNTPSKNAITITPGASTSSGSEASVSAVSGAPNGVYIVNFTATTQSGSLSVYTNFTFTVGIGVNVLPPPGNPPPNKGTINDFEEVPGGSNSEDPAVDYETAGTEVIYNTIQTLLAYNGSLAGTSLNDFVPDLATCVPGSTQCSTMYGSTLQSGDNYTFVINSNAKFYNPSTGVSYSVWPNDVAFSFARTCTFSDFPFGTPGWIQCQALLPGPASPANAANPAWDDYQLGTSAVPLHFPYNSTPTNILKAITLNGTGCPSSPANNGCVTFDTQYSASPSNPSGSWPTFLEFLVDGYGAGIVSCTWATSIGAGLPGWSCGAGTNAQLGSFADTEWDNYQLGLGSGGLPYSALPGGVPLNPGLVEMRYGQSASGYQAIVGSGPYYVSSFSPGSSYQLKVNPAWAGTTCSWTGCIPASFPVKTVNVVWEATAQEGEIALEHGQADFASVPSTDFSSVLLPLVQNGKVTVTSAVSLSIFFTNFVMQFSQSGAAGLLAQSGTGLSLNAPSNLFQDLAFRQFLIHAYPYATVQNQFNTVDGISLGVLYGGAIAKYMGNYYPTNVSWDQVDPVNSGASSWWTNVTSEPNGIAAAACTPSKPCIFPFASYAGAPTQDEINKLWVSDIETYSKGAVEPVPVDINFGNLVVNSESPAGTNPMPMYELGWAPDFPDPTDYVAPLYYPNSTYGEGDALWQGLVGTGSYNTACTASGWEWMASGGVNQACQGYAYNEMISLMNSAAYDTNLQQRALLYNEAEHIAQQIGIFTPNPGQSGTTWIAASWLAGNTLNTNPTIGGGSDNTFYTIQYTG